MANPLIVSCPVGAWTVVASGITAGTIYNMTPSREFMQTYRMAGDAAPSTNADGVFAFNDPGAPLAISASDAIDVYLMAIDGVGSVRVDV